MPRFCPRFCLAALCLLAACAGVSPEDATMSNALCDQGKLLLQTGKADEARDIFASAATRDDANVRAWNGLGVADDMLGRSDEAQGYYQKALALDPENAAALNNLAHSYIEGGAYAKAAALLAPHKKALAAHKALAQNFAVAEQKAALADATPRAYADLGTFSTQALADARAEKARKAIDDDGVKVSVTVAVKGDGGIAMFNLRAVPGKKGPSPADICTAAAGAGLACTPHGA